VVSVRCRRQILLVMHVHNSASSFIIISVEVISLYSRKKVLVVEEKCPMCCFYMLAQ